MANRDELEARYRGVMERVGEAAERSGRRAGDVIVVAVTKTAGPDQVRGLVELGHCDLGENRVQHLQQRVAMTEEFLSRRRMMGPSHGGEPMTQQVRWHMIGHLQRNKVKAVLPLVKLIHSVDSLRLAEEVQAAAAAMDRDADVLLQVNVSGEPSKFGLAGPAAPHLAEQMETMVHLRLRGLMMMAPYSDHAEDSRDCFLRCAELFEEMKSSGRLGGHFNILSMGMSNDFEVAVECGANVVRIGRALFGEGEEER